MSIRLVVSDVDGTIVRSDKSLAPSTVDAAKRLEGAGVALAIVSARPPRGMLWIQQALRLNGKLAGFNGGRIVAPDGSPVMEHLVAEEVSRTALALFKARGIDAWAFVDDDWLVPDADGPHVAREKRAVRFDPVVTADLLPVAGRAAKLVGVSDDEPLLRAAEEELGRMVGDKASVKRSQTYYLDVTAPEANKGNAVRMLAEAQGVSLDEVAVLGDQANDVPMFRVAGFSVAMGNANDEVKAQASAVSPAGNDDDGWARAVDELILKRAAS